MKLAEIRLGQMESVLAVVSSPVHFLTKNAWLRCILIIV